MCIRDSMTCVLGKYALYNQEWERLGADANMLDLVKWHGAEEIEHRTVAFDLYRHLGGGYIARYYLSIAVIIGVIGLWTDGAACLMAQDPRFKSIKPAVYKPWIWREWARIAQKDNRLLPHPLWLVSQQLSFLTPWYDPLHEAKTEDALAYLNRSPAAKRASLKVA